MEGRIGLKKSGGGSSQVSNHRGTTQGTTGTRRDVLDAESRESKLADMRRLEAEEQRDELASHIEEQLAKVDTLTADNQALQVEVSSLSQRRDKDQQKMAQLT
jgi:uncharacterized membrane-anchored protein YhcB (DUF1043 family)